MTLPGAEGDNAVPLRGHDLPFYCRSQRKLASGNILKKAPEQFQVFDNFGEIARAEIIIRHEFKVRFDFLGVIWRKDRKSTRLNSSHRTISYAVFCLKKKKRRTRRMQNR